MKWKNAFKGKNLMLQVLSEIGIFKVVNDRAQLKYVDLFYHGKRHIFLDPHIFREWIDFWQCKDCIYNGSWGNHFLCEIDDSPMADYPFRSDCSTFIPRPNIVGRPYAYFSHSMKEYNTEEERTAIETIRSLMPNHIVLNPRIIPYSGSMYPYLRMVEVSNVVVFRRYKGYITSGVGLEINHAMDHNIPVFELEGNALKRIYELEERPLTREQTVSLYKKGHI